MTNLLKCNVCENRGCPFSDKQLNSMDSSRCKSYVSPEPFRVPILVQLLNSGQSGIVTKLLGDFGLRLKETNEKPYFMLVVNA